MIVQPDFPEHWKTRLLVEITGGDESAPLAVVRLWAHCQHSKRHIFSDMSPAQLASVCRWGDRKPPCHVALTKAGFVEKAKPKGFLAHQWDEHNAQLIQKWKAGGKGGRPAKDEKSNDDGEGHTGSDPTLEGNLPGNDNTMSPTAASGKGGMVFPLIMRERIEGMVEDLAASKRAKSFQEPTMDEVRRFLQMQFLGAEKYAEPFLSTMRKQRWKDCRGVPIADWHAMAKAYASKAEMNSRGVGTPSEIEQAGRRLP